jgi:hypothetical protein
MGLKEKFTRIYGTNGFNGVESLSGTGSGSEQTKIILAELPLLFKRFGVKTLIDAPCGDLFWMGHLLTDSNILERYIGVDIVEELVEKNRERFANELISFEVKNIVEDVLPAGDLILCRDCLVHLTYADAKQAVRNFKASGSKYLLTTTYPHRIMNKDLVGVWRCLNLQIMPFSFPTPLAIINEHCTEVGGAFSDKSLALWELKDLNA